MRKLHKHLLSFEEASVFCAEALQETNTFSEEALKTICQEIGQFFTLLPDNANLNNLHQFSASILPPEPKKRGPVGSLPGIFTHSPVDSMEKEFAAFLYDQMSMHAYQFLADDFNATYKERNTQEWFKLYGVHHLEEVYYFLSPQNAAPHLIEQCLSLSKTFWHSLCMLSHDSALGKIKKSLHLSDIQKFCKSAQFILVGAYDGEGYIVWEKNRPAGPQH